MRHGKKFNHLGRKKGHRHALLRNMANSLIEHKRIRTTVAKAKALRKFIEPLMTKAKNNTTHSRRVVFSYLQSKDSVTALFGEIASAISDRPGGYVRILRTAFRNGDGAEMCIIEMVDFNSDALETQTAKRKRTRRGRRKKTEGETEETTEVAETTEEVVDETPEEEETNEEEPTEDENKDA